MLVVAMGVLSFTGRADHARVVFVDLVSTLDFAQVYRAV